MIIPFRRTQTPEKPIRLLQDAVEATLRSVTGRPIIDGGLLLDIELASGDNAVDHKLGRLLRGYIVVKRSAACDIYNKDIDTRTLILNSSAAVTVTLWVF